jgi:ribonuclease VapC
MFVDASAIVALLTGENEAQRIADALTAAEMTITSPVAVLEIALALARPDKFDRPIAELEPVLREFLDSRDIAICDMPPPSETVGLVLSAAHRFRAGRGGLNLGDCLHYACAKYYRVPILATDDEFRHTDLETIP